MHPNPLVHFPHLQQPVLGPPESVRPSDRCSSRVARFSLVLTTIHGSCYAHPLPPVPAGTCESATTSRTIHAPHAPICLVILSVPGRGAGQVHHQPMSMVHGAHDACCGAPPPRFSQVHSPPVFRGLVYHASVCAAPPPPPTAALLYSCCCCLCLCFSRRSMHT